MSELVSGSWAVAQSMIADLGPGLMVLPLAGGILYILGDVFLGGRG